MSLPEQIGKGIGGYIQNTLSIATLGLVVIAGFYTWNQIQREKEERLLLEKKYAKLIDTREDGKQLTEMVSQLTTTYREQAELQKEAAQAWKEVAIEKEERIKLLETAQIQIAAQKETDKSSDYVFKTPQGTRGYTLNELRIDGKESPPIGYVMVKNDGEVVKQTYPLKIELRSIEIRDDLTGKTRVVTKAFMIPQDNGLADDRRPDLKKWKNEPYQLATVGGSVTVDPQEAVIQSKQEKDWIMLPMNVSPGIGIYAGAKGASSKVCLDTTLLGYGYNKRDQDWKLLNIGINYDDKNKAGLQFTPASYRFSPNGLPNTYLGTGVYLDNTQQGYFLNLSVGF